MFTPNPTKAPDAGTELRQALGLSEPNLTEAGTLSSWNSDRVWARFHKGDTAEACDPADLLMAVRTLDGRSDRAFSSLLTPLPVDVDRVEVGA